MFWALLLIEFTCFRFMMSFALKDGGGGKRPRTKEYKVPFRRVKDEEIEVAPELADNSYEATFGESGWGAKVRLR